MKYVKFDIHNLRHDPRLGRWYTHVRSQPSWVWKIAGVAALVVIVVPILTLALTAGLAFALAFAALSVARRLGRWVRGIRGWGSGSFNRSPRYPDHPAHPPTGGRRNVRVIRSSD